jgi:Ca2+/Na+ antiporter
VFLFILIIADQQIQSIMDQMELMAGAPREAMGIRSPGEKTAFEVQTLDNAAGRIFQEKIKAFEMNLVEPILNDMLDAARRYMDSTEVIRILDTSINVQKFREIGQTDLNASGILRPVGARHFAQQATELQNIIGVFNSPIAQFIAPHTSGIALSEFVNDISNVRGYEIFRPNVAIAEQQETAGLADQASEEMEVQAQTAADPETLPIDA